MVMRPVDALTDEDLDKSNRAHQWVTYCLDANGRKVGRTDGQYCPLPHPSVLDAELRCGLSGKSVVEFGCLEGGHTITLCEKAKAVIALDARRANLEKTRIRCAMFGVTPQLLLCDVETDVPPPADLYFHSGVFYHLQDPISHLHNLAGRSEHLVLNTHYTKNPNATYRSQGNGKQFSCYEYPEDPTGYKAAKRNLSRWLGLKDIVTTLRELYGKVNVASTSTTPNGQWATIYASRPRPRSLRRPS